MATTVIETGACIGAIAGMLRGRGVTGIAAVNYDAVCAAAESFADEVVAKCAAIALADADNAAMINIAPAITEAIVAERGYTGSTTDADYAGAAAVVCAAIKSATAVVP